MTEEEIGITAGAIWHALERSGEMTVSGLKKELDSPSPIFDWAIGWLAREHKIIITKEKRSWLVRLEGQSANVVGHQALPISDMAGASA